MTLCVVYAALIPGAFDDSQPFRSRANSLPGANQPIGPWPIRSLELSLTRTFTPWRFRSRNFRSLERIGPGTFALKSIRSLELSLSGTFVLLVRDIICDILLYSNDMYL